MKPQFGDAAEYSSNFAQCQETSHRVTRAATHLLVAVTALVTYIVVSDDGQSTADQDHTSDAQSMPEFGKTSLRDTAARMNKRLDQLRLRARVNSKCSRR